MTRKTNAELQAEVTELQKELTTVVPLLEVAKDQIGSFRNTVRVYDKQVGELEQKIVSDKATSDMWYNKQCEANAKLEQIHCVLDAVEGVPKRKVKPGEKDYLGNKVEVILSVEARLITCVRVLILQGIEAGSKK